MAVEKEERHNSDYENEKMDKYWPVIIVVLIWGIGSGLGLRFSVPLMKNIQDNTLIILSAAIPLMFLPSMLVHAWRLPIWWVLAVQILIALLAAPVSGYFVDTIASYLLLGVISLIIVYISTLISSETTTQILLAYTLSFFILTTLNIYGHNITENGISLLLKIIIAMAVSFSICTLATIKLLR